MLALQKNKYKYWIASVILMILGATRAASVGNDLRGGYSLEFSSIQMDPTTWGHYMPQFERGFAWLMAFFKTYISSTSIYFFHLVFFFSFGCMIFFVKKQSRHPAMVMFFMFALAYYFSFYNIMRQEMAFAFICALSFAPIWGVDDLVPKPHERGKIIMAISIVVVVSFLIHNSQIILLLALPAYLFYQKKFFDTKYMIFLIALSAVFSMTLAKNAFAWMGNFAYLFAGSNSNTAGYMVYSENFGLYSTSANLVNSLVAIYIVYSCRFKRTPFLLLFVLGACLQNVLTPISWIFARVANTFLFFKIFVFADLWYEIPNKKERNVYRMVIFCYSVMMFANRLINDHENDVVPYVNYYIDRFL